MKKNFKLLQGDNMESFKKLPDNSIDSVVTDGPYGLSFMNKKWDYYVPSVEFWKEVYRVLKPGGHVLSFGGTRTYHRMVVNIEDAGFEIRDQIQWLYGSGFPKSLNVGKAVDKYNGLEIPKNKMRVVNSVGIDNHNGSGLGRRYDMVEYNVQNEWSGWGTALKPSQEIVAVAQKPENLEGTALNLIYIIKNELWKLYVKIVESSSELNQVEQKEVLDIAQCLVEKNTNILDALQGLMDMSQLRLMENMPWSIVGLWSNILEDLYQKMSRYTTSTKSNLIIDLKTLKSLEWQSILESITQVKDNQTDGMSVNALTAVVLFNALNLKLKDIQQHSVEDNVIYKEDKKDCLNSPICVARKPLSEKSVAENVLKWGTGGINIDGCRISTTDTYNYKNGLKGNSFSVGKEPDGKSEPVEMNQEGRFPANIILDESAAEMLDEQSGVSTSRFFYIAKVSKKERNMGSSNRSNHHPTVKPVQLMSYLCRLITPPNGVILDPFMGSGSTGIAACLEGFRFVGMEMDPDYFNIASSRIENYEKYREFLNKKKK
jgi:DNA modification methylase